MNHFADLCNFMVKQLDMKFVNRWVSALFGDIVCFFWDFHIIKNTFALELPRKVSIHPQLTLKIL